MDIKQSWLFTKPIAHRGLHTAKLPENSLSAYENAIKNGYPIEIDIRIIDDGNIIVFHDEKLARMTNHDGYACNLKTSDLDNIRLGKTDEKIPTFEQLLEFVNGRTPILIEIKNEGKIGKLEHKAIEMLRSYNGEFAVQSFNPFSIEYFKNRAPDIIRGILSSFFPNSDLAFYKKFILKRMLLNNRASPDFISYEHNYLPNKYVTKSNLPTLAWTLKSNSDMEKVLPYCDNIIFEGFTPKK